MLLLTNPNAVNTKTGQQLEAPLINRAASLGLVVLASAVEVLQRCCRGAVEVPSKCCRSAVEVLSNAG